MTSICCMVHLKFNFLASLNWTSVMRLNPGVYVILSNSLYHTRLTISAKNKADRSSYYQIIATYSIEITAVHKFTGTKLSEVMVDT